MMVGRKNWLKRFKMEKRRLNYPFIVSRKSVIGSEQNVFSQGKKSKQSKAKHNKTQQNKAKQNSPQSCHHYMQLLCFMPLRIIATSILQIWN